jgi:predicted ATPase/transcriptional regulator with XRE-family HTH domain
MSESLGATRSGTTAFGTVLRSMRLAAGLSQGALAERAGLSEKAVGALERGDRTTPRPATVVLLADAMGASPAERDRLLAAAHAEGRPPERGLPTDTDAESVARHGLLVPPTPLLGRQQDIAAVSQLVSPPDGAARLVTLIGPGGVGKTRVALAVALELVDAFADDVWFVDLSPLRDYRLVAASVARALDVRESGGRSAQELLIDALRERLVLLVLDNFEHVLDAAPFVADLLSKCPRLTVLVTSRTALRLRAERRFMVEPLSVPRADGPHALETVANSPAVQLFVDRAQAIVPDFELTPSNRDALGAICRRLDGLPLAIELAAAGVPLLSPDALLRRLERPFPELSAGIRDLPSRHQTLYNTLAWSYALLGPAEQALLRRLAVFAGGWTLEAPEAVCGGTDLPSEAVLGHLRQLVESSLVQVLDAGRDERRFGLLETIREFAQQELQASGEEAAIREAHAHYMSALAGESFRRLVGPEQVEWIARTAREQDNFRAALRWLLDTGQLDEAGYLLRDLVRFWWMHGQVVEARRWAELVLAGDTEVPRAARANASFVAAIAALVEGNEAAVTLAEQACSLARAMGDRWLQGSSLVVQGVSVAISGDIADGIELLQQGRQLVQEVGDDFLVGIALGNLSTLSLFGGEVDEAERYAEEYVALAQRTADSDVLSMAHARNYAATVALVRQDLDRVTDLLTASIPPAVKVGQPDVVAYGFMGLAVVAAGEDPVRAARLFGAAEQLRERGGVVLWPPLQMLYTQPLESVRGTLGTDAFTAAWAEGRAMTREQAVAYALAGEPASV